MSFIKQKVSFSSKFGPFFSVMRDNSSVLFWLKLYMLLRNHCSVSWKITPPYFFSSKFTYFGQKQPIEVKFWNFWVVEWKFSKFLMSYLKLQVIFSLNFVSLCSVMRNNSFVLFSWNFILCWRRQPIKVPNYRFSFSPNLCLDRLLLLKVYQISAKKVQRSCVSWYWRLMQNLKKNWFVVLKLTRTCWNLIRALKSQKFTLWLVPCVKSI